MRILVALCAAVLLMTSCTKKTPDGNYTYVHHVSKNAQKPQVGEIVYFQIHIFAGDSLLQSSRKEGEPGVMRMPEIKKEDKDISPVVAALKLMGIGDSMSVELPIDTSKKFERLKTDFPKVKSITYRIYLDKIQSEADFNKEMEVKRAEFEKENAAKQVQIEANKKVLAVTLKAIPANMKAAVAKFQAKAPGIKDLGNGLFALITTEGTGQKVEKGTTALVQYYGALTNGKSFDESFSRGEALDVPVGGGRVIPGWDIGLTAFSKGSKGYLYIPSAMAYGPQGSPPRIPANSDLVFYVEIEDVLK
jgi:FKBP-type peptidyl-prolyl cis-trans isomerase FkpA